MGYDYDIDVVAGSKACIAGYSAVHARIITAVWAYYRHIEEWGERGRKVGAGKEGKGRRKGGRKEGQGNQGR